MTHPLPIGTKVVSIHGEEDLDDDVGQRHTGPNAVGEIREADHYEGQGWTYGLAFSNGTFVFVDQQDSIDDPTKYVVCDAKGVAA